MLHLIIDSALHLINQLDAQIVLAHEDEMDMLFANGGEDSIAMGSH